MEHEQYRSSMIAFICSIVPIGIAVALIGLVELVDPAILRPGEWGDFGGLLYGPFRLCAGILIGVMTMPLAAYCVSWGVAAIKAPEAKGKPLAGSAIVLGLLEIVMGTAKLLESPEATSEVATWFLESIAMTWPTLFKSEAKNGNKACSDGQISCQCGSGHEPLTAWERLW